MVANDLMEPFKGYGGCPMAKDDLTGNMPTEQILHFFNNLNLLDSYELDAAKSALDLSTSVYNYAEG